MNRFRLVLLSDIHVSDSHPFFFHNWDVALEAANALAPDIAVISGDLSLNGPDRSADLAFAARQIARLDAPVVRALPGNHDVGYAPSAAGASQVITEPRRAAWLRQFGQDFWRFDHGGWRFVGLNPFLFESGWDAETEQADMLDAALATAPGPVGVFLHVPLFAHEADETDADTTATLRPGPRAGLLERFERSGAVRFVASGHLHRTKRLRHMGVDHYWAPGTAFMSTGARNESWGGEPWVGFLEFRFDGQDVSVVAHEPAEMLNIDLRNWAKNDRHLYFDVAARPYRQPA